MFRAALGPHFSEGARRLWAVVDVLGRSSVARTLGVQSGVVGRWLYGDRRPSIECAAKIERELRIPARLFAAAPLEPFVPPAARRPVAA